MPKNSSLDRSATLPCMNDCIEIKSRFNLGLQRVTIQLKSVQGFLGSEVQTDKNIYCRNILRNSCKICCCRSAFDETMLLSKDLSIDVKRFLGAVL